MLHEEVISQLSVLRRDGTPHLIVTAPTELAHFWS